MLYYRQKLALALIEVFGGSLLNTDFQKYMFLFCEKYKPNQRYYFIPYKRGCFSFQSYTDRNYLVDNDYLEDVKYWKLAHKNQHFRDLLKKNDKENLYEFRQKFKDLKGDKLIKYVYLKYPYYTLKSEITDRILTYDERESINKANKIEFDKMTSTTLFTIGYEGLSIEEYLNKLIKNNISLVVDVRKNPLSRKYGFSKLQLCNYLKKIDIEYVHFPELGIESENRKDLETKDDYQKLFDYYEKNILNYQHENLSKLTELLIENKRIALTCFEADYEMCHRSRIAKCLRKSNDWDYEYINI